jgi:acylphosphatase
MAGTAAGAVRLEVEIRGRVQGVGFRYFVAEVATARGIVGWVANEPDGSLRCVVEGSRPDLDGLLDELRRGPLGARVEDVRSSWGGATGAFDHFWIRAGAHRGD